MLDVISPCCFMKSLGFVATQRLAYKVTTRREDAYKVARNLPVQDFNSVDKDDV